MAIVTAGLEVVYIRYKFLRMPGTNRKKFYEIYVFYNFYLVFNGFIMTTFCIAVVKI